MRLYNNGENRMVSRERGGLHPRKPQVWLLGSIQNMPLAHSSGRLWVNKGGVSPPVRETGLSALEAARKSVLAHNVAGGFPATLEKTSGRYSIRREVSDDPLSTYSLNA